ncbi:MAG: class I SAM-dependent methyltransferase [Thermoplasmatales archaeon]|nr:class I SAM-dependent methyltransferase [Thermoplasmatales archaeon]
MTYTFQTIGEPKFKEFFTIKDKIYYELVHRLLKFGKTYVPRYFVRGMTAFMFNYFNNPLTGIEIGTAEGENAKTMFNILPIHHLYCIDPYNVYTEKDIGRISNTKEQLEYAKKNLKDYLDKVTFVKEYSHNCLELFADNHFDFVYIDGNHDYSCVKQDIELYYPKVKVGGVLGGHDFGGRFYGVLQAVLEFIEQYDYKLFNGRDSDWWIVKK